MTITKTEQEINESPNNEAANKTSIIVYKDKSYLVLINEPTWEYENDPEWFVTINLYTI